MTDEERRGGAAGGLERAPRRRWITIAGALWVAAAQAQSPGAPGVTPSAAGPRVAAAAVLDSALAVQLRRMEGTRIGLEQAVREALAHNTTVAQADARLQAAAAAVRRERGVFDPEVFASGIYSDTDYPTASPFAGADVLKEDGLATSFGAGMRLTTGTQLRASIQTTRRGTNSRYATLDPQYDARGSIDLVQPLLKGAGIAARVELTAAEQELEAEHANYEGTVDAVRSQVERTYWDLYASERDVAVERVVVDGAAAVRESAERRANAGLVGPNQVANARVFLADQQALLLTVEERLDGASDRLASLIGRRPDAGDERFRTTGEPPTSFALLPQDEVVAIALQHNATLRVIASRTAALEAREGAAARDALPQLDLVGSLGSAGLAGTGQDVIFGADTLRTDLDTGWGDSWSQVFSGDFPTWSAGVVFTLPLGRRSGTGEQQRRAAEVRFAQEQRVAAERALEETVRARCRELEHAERRLAIVTESVAASSEQVRIGRLEFESGRTTAFELVRLGGDLASAQLRYSQALVRAAQAAAELRELTAGMYPPVP